MTDPSADDSGSDSLESAWSAVERGWEDDGAHRRFLALCAATGQLAEAGQRYRRVRDHDAARAPEAERRIQSLLALATEQLLRHKTPPREKGTPRLTFVAVGVALVIIGMTLWQLARLR